VWESVLEERRKRGRDGHLKLRDFRLTRDAGSKIGLWLELSYGKEKERKK
jgi:hypothetical protein